MVKLGKELLDFLSSDDLNEVRKELYGLLKEDSSSSNEIYVYYLVHLKNLVEIVKSGGIKCRDMSNMITDLSVEEVQNKRNNIILRLARDIAPNEATTDKNAQNIPPYEKPLYEKINKKIHQCVNFYWNPLNDTFYAFQRNAFLLEVDDTDNKYGIVCVLEMRLKDFFEDSKIYWTTSEKNLASDKFASFAKSKYGEFNWKTIFSVKDNKNTDGAGYKTNNQFRSAEFVVFCENSEQVNKNSDPIPIRFIKRILVHNQSLDKTKDKLRLYPSVQRLVFPLESLKVFHSKKILLNAEINMVQKLLELKDLNLSVQFIENFCELINTFSKFKEYLGCTLTEEYFFKNKNIAHSIHGIGHTTRVMFWAHVLCFLFDIDKQKEKSVLYAAFIHDLGRKSNDSNEEQGSDSVKKYENFLREKIPHDYIESCKNAVIYSCKKDSRCPEEYKDDMWKILKYADVLDRGLSDSHKGIYSNQKILSEGCDVDSLMLSYPQELKEKIAWLAYYVVSITHYTKWSDDSFMDFKKEIIKSLKAISGNNILSPDEKETADKMLGYLSTEEIFKNKKT
ncbi:MAG: hypothetical protein BWK75_00325 [Candidatus Altiarchaeales archaeon A3]|nr:MAG: hypothetical protein BWK75_00325 [Candidatus Altiarchaeales archaeon A3]